MGRTLKRVPMNFDAPHNKVWKGYINPHYKATACPHCEGGYSADYKRLEAQWYSHKGGEFTPEMRDSVPFTPDDEIVQEIIAARIARDGRYDAQAIHREAVRMCAIWNSSWSHHLNESDVAALIEADRLWDFTRRARTEAQSETVRMKIADGGNSWLPESNGYIPLAREVNQWSLSGLGHDSTNCWIVIGAELTRLGLPSECEHCNGEGEVWESEKDRGIYEAWEDFEPPIGEGYQLWETTSEGSPISPVFDTIERLCAWCEAEATTFGSYRATAQEWREMLDEDFVIHREGNMIYL